MIPSSIATQWHKINTISKKLLNLLPGKNKIIVQASAKSPSEIIQQLQQHQNCDTVLLTNGDVWRNSNDVQLLNFFDKNKSTKFFIQHLGYHNSKPMPNAWEVSFNGFYFSRIITELNIKKSLAPLGFGCLNRTPRFHRTWLAYQLWSQGVIDKVVFSIRDVTEYTDYLRLKLESQPGWADFFQHVPMHHPGTDQGDVADISVIHLAYQTFCNIVTESETEWFKIDTVIPTPVITEKTWKPFLSCQIPIFYAAQGQLEYLKSFGFEVFEDILPAGYDNMGTIDKAQAIVDVVARGRDWIADIYVKNSHKIQHNHELAVSDKVEQMMFDRVVDFVYN